MTTWPRMMKRATAAAYCDLSERAFEREINAGRLPGPVTLGGREHWCKNALDRALDQLTGAQMNRRKLSKAAIVKLDAHRRKSA